MQVLPQATGEFWELIIKVTSRHSFPKEAVERCKSIFASANGSNVGTSSNLDWAQSDLLGEMRKCAENAPVFIETVWNTIEYLKSENLPVPDAKYLDDILSKHNTPYELAPPNILIRKIDAVISSQPDLDQGSSSFAYKLHEEIGSGGFGRVFRVTRSTSIDEFEYAMKLFDPSPFVADPDKAKARFSREVKAVRNLDHSGIVTYSDAGIDSKGQPYLVMPFIRGDHLNIAASKLSFHQRCELMVKILDAIAYAHSIPIFHRDLKPSNIIVRHTDNQPIIVDFGQAYMKDAHATQSLTTNLVGSAAYIPPEVNANPKDRSPLHDIYSCGMILFEIINGTIPDPLNYSSLAAVESSLAVLDEVIKKAIAGRQARFQSASEFRAELRSAMQQLPH